MQPFASGALDREIGEHVGAPEPVDGLLRIADHDEDSRAFLPLTGQRGRGFAIDSGEDAGLNRIRILVLVDEGAGVLVADPRGETGPALAVQRLLDLDEQIVVGESPVVPDATPHRSANLEQDLAAGPSQPSIAGRAQLLRRPFEAVEPVEQRIVGQLEVALARLRELLPAVTPGRALFRKPRIGGIEQHLHCGQLLLGALRPIARPVQPPPLPNLGQKAVPVLRPLGPCRLVDLAPRRFVHLDRLRKGIAADDGHAGLGAPLRHPGGERIGHEAARDRMAQHERGRRIHAAAPAVAHRRVHHLATVAHLESEQEAALEREIGQHPLAEAVDRVHVRPVDVAHRAFEAPREGGIDAPSPVRPRLEQLQSLRIVLAIPRIGAEPGFGRVTGLGPMGGRDLRWVFGLPSLRRVFGFLGLGRVFGLPSLGWVFGLPSLGRIFGFPSLGLRHRSVPTVCPTICALAGPHRGQDRSEHPPDPIPELRGGGAGERDDEDPVERPVLLNDEASHEGGERVGLPRPGARFDERRPVAVQRKIERRAAAAGRAGFGAGHYLSAPASGTSSSIARSSKSAVSGSTPSWRRLK